MNTDICLGSRYWYGMLLMLCGASIQSLGALHQASVGSTDLPGSDLSAGVETIKSVTGLPSAVVIRCLLPYLNSWEASSPLVNDGGINRDRGLWYARALAYLGDDRLASVAPDGTIKIWNRLGACIKILNGHQGFVMSLACLGDHRLASGSVDRTIKIWDIDSGACIKTLNGHQGWELPLVYLGYNRLASGSSSDSTIKIWDIGSGECTNILSYHYAGVWALVYLGNNRLASGSPSDSAIKIWDIGSGECINTLSGHKSSVDSLAYLGNNRLVSGSGDGTIKLWDSRSGECINTLSVSINGLSRIQLLSLSKNLFVSGSQKLARVSAVEVKIWNAVSGLCVQELTDQNFSLFSFILLDNHSFILSTDNRLKYFTNQAETLLQAPRKKPVVKEDYYPWDPEYNYTPAFLSYQRHDRSYAKTKGLATDLRTK